MSQATSVHRALADDRRVAIVNVLRRAGPLDVRELGRRVWLHPNTVRFHLALLREAGLVTARPTRDGKAGRPRILYSAAGTTSGAGASEHRWLAAILSAALDGATDGIGRAQRAGRAWGRRVVERPPPGDTGPDTPVPSELIRLLGQLGFDPEVQARRVLMRRCPFDELPQVSSALVCAVHRGLIEGALETLGGTIALDTLEYDRRLGVCIAQLQDGDARQA